MNNKEVEGFLNNPFFNAIVKVKPNNDLFKSQLKDCKISVNDADCHHVFLKLCNFYKDMIPEQNISTANPYYNIVMVALVDAFSDCDLLQYFCDEEEDVNKIDDLIWREQYNSKLLKNVTARICRLLIHVQFNAQVLSLVLYTSVKSRINDYNTKHILRTMGALKKIIDRVASGVLDKCYLEFEKAYPSSISKELDEYIVNTYGYSLENQRFDYLIQTSDVDILSLAVLNDKDFWKFNEDYRKKSIIQFADIVAKYNSFAHATKIVDYAFEKVCENKKCRFLFDNKLPLCFCDDLEMKMAYNCAEIIERRFGGLFNFKLSESEKHGLIYPIYSGDDSFIEEGKELFKKFIIKAYPNDSNIVLGLFNDLDNLIQDEKKVGHNEVRRTIRLRDYLEFELLGWDDRKELKEKFLNGYYQNYGSNESILGRFYYRLYLINKYTSDASEECIFEYLFAMFSMIDGKYNTKCLYGLDQSLRDENYEGLKSVLAKYDINIDDSFKESYVIALLDRKCATINEASMFAELEQLGDAIYELAIDNIIFYHPNSNMKLDHRTIEEYVKAPSQVKIAKKIGVDKLYISKLHSKLRTKYVFNEGYEIGAVGYDEENYIADSLEMIIGAIAKEFTVQKALDFATEIIVEANKELKKPEFVENFDIEALFKSNYDKDYFEKIHPSLFSIDDSDYLSEYHMIWRSLIKILRIMIFGNDTKEKRIMIAHSLNDDIIPKNDNVDWTTLVVNYLHFGIEHTIEKCKAIIEYSYSK